MTEVSDEYYKSRKKSVMQPNWKFKITGLNPALSDMDKQIASLNRRQRSYARNLEIRTGYPGIKTGD